MPLQGDPDFERLVSLSKAAQDKDVPEVKPVLLHHWPESYTTISPLLVALHGNSSNADKTLPFWQSATSQGWGLAVAQSSQVMFKDAYVWDNLETSLAEVAAHIDSLNADPQRTVVAGHSMGGLVAIQGTLMQRWNVRGFVALGPAVPFLETPELLDSLLAPARERGVRGYFIVGEKDDDINGLWCMKAATDAGLRIISSGSSDFVTIGHS
jgi:pimeloyl-ACP methyl ester carboxylesterase